MPVTARQIVAVEPFYENSDFSEPLEAFISRLQDILNTIPETHRSKAMFEFTGGSEHESGRIGVRYTRPQNDEEYAETRRWYL